MRAELVPASLVHIGPLANRMREADRRECEAFGRSSKDALRLSLRTSLHALTALNGESKPVAMFGVTPVDMISGLGSPWFLGSDEVFDYARDLLERGPRIIGWFHDTFGTMENLVSRENVKAIRLLRAWGAQIGEEPQSVGGLEFVRFRFSAAIQASALAA